jgi:hypothetical protein
LTLVNILIINILTNIVACQVSFIFFNLIK